MSEGDDLGTAMRVTLAQARHAWFLRQRLGSDAGRRGLVDLVGEIGWVAMTSPATPYLSLFARGALTSRGELDDLACKKGELSVVPGPRGSSFLVPTVEAPLARAFAVADHASREARVAAAVTLTSRDLQATRDALRAAIAPPATADEIRGRIPAAMLRSLGDVGRKNGLPTLAALVLRHMWVMGEVVRIAADGRLDGHTVRWGLDPRPRTVPTAADAVDAIAGRWLTTHAPLSSKAFATTFGIAAGRANAALKPVKPLEVEVEGLDGPHLVPGDFTPPDTTVEVPVRLLPLRDPLPDAHVAGMTAPTALRLAMTRGHGVAPSVLVDGELVATWLYDEVARVITWRPLGAPPPAEVAARIDLEARRVANFLGAELGAAFLHTTQGARPRASHAPPPDDLSIEI